MRKHVGFGVTVLAVALGLLLFGMSNEDKTVADALHPAAKLHFTSVGSFLPAKKLEPVW
jgi:hypothetical protein